MIYRFTPIDYCFFYNNTTDYLYMYYHLTLAINSRIWYNAPVFPFFCRTPVYLKHLGGSFDLFYKKFSRL